MKLKAVVTWKKRAYSKEVQRNLVIRMLDFDKKMNEFKNPLNRFIEFVDSNPETFHEDTVPSNYKEFSDNMANYEFLKKKFLKSWDKEKIDRMIEYLSFAHNDLYSIHELLFEIEKKMKLTLVDKILRRKSEYHRILNLVNNVMKIIKKHIEYLKHIKDYLPSNKS